MLLAACTIHGCNWESANHSRRLLRPPAVCRGNQKGQKCWMLMVSAISGNLGRGLVSLPDPFRFYFGNLISTIINKRRVSVIGRARENVLRFYLPSPRACLVRASSHHLLTLLATVSRPPSITTAISHIYNDMDIAFDATWCPTCSRQILPKRIQVPAIPQPPAAAPATPLSLPTSRK